MLRKLVSTVAAATLAAAPLAAQAAPERLPTSVSEAEGMEGSSWVLPAILGLGLIIVIWLAIDSENDGEAPLSP